MSCNTDSVAIQETDCSGLQQLFLSTSEIASKREGLIHFCPPARLKPSLSHHLMRDAEISLGCQVFRFSVIRKDYVNLILGEGETRRMNVNSAVTLALRASDLVQLTGKCAALALSPAFRIPDDTVPFLKTSPKALTCFEVLQSSIQIFHFSSH